MSNLNMNYTFSYILNNYNKDEIINYINKENPKYLILPQKYGDIAPYLSNNSNIKILYGYNKIKELNKNNLEGYFIDKYINNGKFSEGLIITYDKLNESSVEITDKNNTIIYISKIKNENER